MSLRIEIRDRRLRGGRMSISAATDSRVVKRKREAAIRALLDRGDIETIDRLRRKQLHISAIERAVREGDLGALRPQLNGSLALGAVFDRVLKIVDATRAADTSRQYKLVAKWLTEVFGADRDMATITKDDAREFLHGSRRNGKPWAPSTQQTFVAYAGRFWREAIEYEADESERLNVRPRLIRNPWREVERAQVRQTRVVFLQPAEWRRLAKKVSGRPEAAAMALGCLAGLRLSETIYLRTDVDVDLEQRRLLVQSRGGAYPWKPKTWRGERTLRIGDELSDILAAHIDSGFAGQRYLVRVVGRDRPISRKALEQWTERAFGAAGIKYGRDGDGLTYHSLRHTFASWLVQRDVQLKKIAELLGDTAAVVEKTYAHLLPKDLDSAVDLVDDIARGGA